MLILQKKNGFGSGDMPKRSFTEVVTLETLTANPTSAMDVDSAGNVYWMKSGGTSQIQKYDAVADTVTSIGPDWDEWGGGWSWRCSEAYSLVVDNAGTYVYLWKANLGGSNCDKALYNALYRVKISDGTYTQLYRESNSTSRLPISMALDKDTNSTIYGIKGYGSTEYFMKWDIVGDVATPTINGTIVTANKGNLILDKANNNLFAQDSVAAIKWQEMTLDNLPNVENNNLYADQSNGRTGSYLYGNDMLWIIYGGITVVDINGTSTLIAGTGVQDGTVVDGTIASGNIRIGIPQAAAFNKTTGQFYFTERDGSNIYHLRVLR